MKKIISLLLLFAVLFSFVPGVTQGITIPESRQGCEINHDIKLKGQDTGFESGEVVCAEGKTSIEGSDGSSITCIYNRNDWGMVCVIDTVFNVMDWIFWVLIVVGVIFVMLGAYFIVVAAGDPEKMGKGKQFIVGGIIGMVIGVFAKALPSLIISVLGL